MIKDETELYEYYTIHLPYDMDFQFLDGDIIHIDSSNLGDTFSECYVIAGDQKMSNRCVVKVHIRKTGWNAQHTCKAIFYVMRFKRLWRGVM